MTTVDPYAPIKDWQTSLYRGEPAVLDRFLDAIDAHLPTGWVRDRDFEQGRLGTDGRRCYLFDREGDAAVRVGLQRVTPTRVRGDWFEILRRPPSGDGVEIARRVAEFADGCVRLAASTVGVRCTLPAFGPYSAITFRIKSLLDEFAETADGEWPLPDRLDDTWWDLITACLTDHVAFDRNELLKWLEDNGWKPEDATALADKLFADSRWLAKRLAAVLP